MCCRRGVFLPRADLRHISSLFRHPGLVPGSNVPQAKALKDGWMPERVRHDGENLRRGLLHRGADAIHHRLHLRRIVAFGHDADDGRSEEHTSEPQSLMRISYAVFCLKKKKNPPQITDETHAQKRT